MAGGPLPNGFSPGLEATSYKTSDGMPTASGSNIAEVEVDIGTGEVRVLRYSVAHDCGQDDHPMMVDGQIVGGVVHGIGNALFERLVYDEAGQPLNNNYGEYLLPIATEMPPIAVTHQETPSPFNPPRHQGRGRRWHDPRDGGGGGRDRERARAVRRGHPILSREPGQALRPDRRGWGFEPARLRSQKRLHALRLRSASTIRADRDRSSLSIEIKRPNGISSPSASRIRFVKVGDTWWFSIFEIAEMEIPEASETSPSIMRNSLRMRRSRGPTSRSYAPRWAGWRPRPSFPIRRCGVDCPRDRQAGMMGNRRWDGRSGPIWIVTSPP